MRHIQDYFEKTIVINLAHRTDRWESCLAQFKKFEFKDVIRFEAHDMKHLSNHGCTASHRGVLELIRHNRWDRTLVLEDDFQIRHDDVHDRFVSMIHEVPDNWDILYLGAHYGDERISRVSPHVIRASYVKTTSSYGITLDYASKICPYIGGGNAIDELYSGFNEKANSYVFSPRLMVQSYGFSDIQQIYANHALCMEDTRHENLV